MIGPHNDDPTGPSHGTLKSIFYGLPSMIHGIKTGKIGGKGIKVVAPTVPRNVCAVCGKTFNLLAGAIQRPDVTKSCKDCQKALDDGFVALKAGNHYAFVRSPTMKDMAGQIHEVSVQTMQSVKDKFNVKLNEIEPSNIIQLPPNEQTPPTPPKDAA